MKVTMTAMAMSPYVRSDVSIFTWSRKTELIATAVRRALSIRSTYLRRKYQRLYPCSIADEQMVTMKAPTGPASAQASAIIPAGQLVCLILKTSLGMYCPGLTNDSGLPMREATNEVESP